ncbi:hypothetical protein PLANPX_2428 [Lacipirellula parvula]|uniref:Uncharacterized protein n=1 Tax=Lacipirellula parvula TaxID=2650471 RepID=A0A5K7XEQ0_9BACT|nr:hypothetical protein PLANPX_2428 [Lacipirellula parvula]
MHGELWILRRDNPSVWLKADGEQPAALPRQLTKRTTEIDRLF